uniref:Tc1-like transposase DDE domain-containing protein n=1 Tax=Labrus bergylta TaxID=56723 RepID=A0A3Q3MJW9_9LABR
MENLPYLLCQCQTAYSAVAIDSWFELLIPQLLTISYQEDNTQEDHFLTIFAVKVCRTACCPDLNPIEYLWDQLGCAVHTRVTNTTTLADLRQMLVEEWDAIRQQCVTRLVSSMRRRCQTVVAMYGFSTSC